MGPTPILETARAYGLRPRLWLLIGVKILKVYEFKWSDLQDRSCELKIFKTNGFYSKYLVTHNLLANC